MKILLIKFRNIGDVLLMTPLIKNLKLIFPNSTIDIVINKESETILKNNVNINKLFLYDRSLIKKQNLLNKIKFEIEFARNIIRNRYDLIINLTEGDRGTIISLLTKAKKKFGYLPKNKLLKALSPYNRYKTHFEQIHAVERDLSFLEFLDKKPIEKRIEIYFSKQDLEKTKKFKKNFIVLHPVAKWQYKFWEIDRFAKIIDYLIENNQKVIITGSPNPKELAIIDEIISIAKHKPVNLAGQLTLKETAALYSKAKLFIGLDTAPMHMAAAVDIPVITLFGLSDPVVWGPWENSLQTSCYKDIRKTQYCGKHVVIQYESNKIIYQKGIKKSEAMLKITPEDVIKEIKKKI
ncbi:putative lipopolysaccharide heptosyltransferase III [Nitrosophilus alvini]|uniref:putative lipopolysaccharide heptosyltransferase III n=1 Tax=Nitrosophilus alvini TaxID=2714855 RepID=UPI00190E0876|nr:putative lipopolysaccharide heptosyltransferase III [Nitrosophilus alvini]